MSDSPLSSSTSASPSASTDSSPAPLKIHLNGEHVLRITQELPGVKVAQIAAAMRDSDNRRTIQLG